MNWVFLPAFDPASPVQHGGVFRSRQVGEDLRALGPTHTVLPLSARAPGLREIATTLQAMARWRLAPDFALHYLRFHRALAPLRASGLTHCLYEHQAGMGRIGAMVALDLGFETIACPNNLEALANWHTVDPLTRRTGLAGLAWELDFLRRMKAVLTISREEMWLLRSFGLAASYYRYWPDTQTERELLALRAERAAAQPRGPLLILGSAINAPTLQGMARLLAHLKDRRCDVAGYGVGRLAASHGSSNFVFHDPADNATLARLQTAAPCACVHQDRGAGVLTRIRHLLLAGVPVVANQVAARDYHDEQDVRVYSALTELPQALNALDPASHVATVRTARMSLAAALQAAAEIQPDSLSHSR